MCVYIFIITINNLNKHQLVISLCKYFEEDRRRSTFFRIKIPLTEKSKKYLKR